MLEIVSHSNTRVVEIDKSHNKGEKDNCFYWDYERNEPTCEQVKSLMISEAKVCFNLREQTFLKAMKYRPSGSREAWNCF